jgi:hypothetical protein
MVSKRQRDSLDYRVLHLLKPPPLPKAPPLLKIPPLLKVTHTHTHTPKGSLSLRDRDFLKVPRV